MSIIIRLQNLPLSARSGDIRKFFGGLRIPDGGVHILGGDKGDAFIAFMSDEDARLAMRKDGGRIKDSRVRLFLSSHMEMQHEVEKVTKNTLSGEHFHKDIDINRSWSPARKRHSCSRSPLKYDDWNNDKSGPLSDFGRSASPIKYSARGSSPPRYRSRSPRKRSRSPPPFLPSQRVSSFKPKPFPQRRRSASPKASSHAYSLPIDNLSHSVWKNSESQFSSQSERQAELEKRITEELEKNVPFRKNFNERESKMPPCSIDMRGNLSGGIQDILQQSIPVKNAQDNFIFFPHSSDGNNIRHYQDTEFKHNFSINKNQQGNLSSEMSLKNIKERRKKNDGFYITLSGMDPNWDFREVQLTLKGTFAPQNHIRLEKDDAGYKTGTAFVKLTNKDDFDAILKKKAVYYNSRRIAVSECPDFVVQRYFQYDSDLRSENYVPHNRDLCYILKGLPFSCKYDDVISFFHGYEIADIIIFYGDDGKATGTGFVSFTNWKDFEGAASQNGKKIAHRYIELLPSTDKEMSEAKKTQPGGNFVPYSKILSEKNLPASRRPLCAILTGLPLNINTKRILNFFAESGLKPDAVHLTLSKKRLSDGRAFVEFTNFLDFDLALKFHGKRLDKNIVCVKQILYDEMVKILDSQKAKHYFETSTPTASATDEPEKVPYLWEPPDVEQEKDSHVRDHRAHSSTAFPYNKTHSDFPPSASSKRNFDSHYGQTVTNAMADILTFPLYPNNAGLGPLDLKSRNTGNFAPNPVQFNNSKQFAMTRPANEAFHPTRRYEENIKSSRLSPANEAALLDFLNRDRKPSPGRNNNTRCRSLERRDRNTYPDRSGDEIKRYFKDDNISKPRYKDNPRIKNEREFRHDDRKYDSRDRSPARSNPLHFNNEKRHAEDKCIVQLSNVDVSVGTRDLINFLRGFDFGEDTLIRRYTVDGQPTPDVRVTFCDRREAERAIRILNKRTLREKRVSMFIV